MKRALGVRPYVEGGLGALLRLRGQRVVLVDGDNGQMLGADAVDRLSSALGAWAAPRPGPMASLLPNSLEFALTVIGALRAGVPLAPAHPDLTPHEISRLLITTGSRCVVTTSMRVPKVLEARHITERVLSSKYPLDIVTSDSEMTFNEGVYSLQDILNRAKGTLPPSPDPKATALLMETAGHLVRLSHTNIIANCLQVNEVCPLKEDSVVAGILPMYIGYGLIHVLINSLIQGARLVTLSRFQPKAVGKAVSKHGITVIPAYGDTVSLLGGKFLENVEAVVAAVPPPGRPKLPPLPPGVRLATFHGLPAGPVLFHCGRPLPQTRIKVVDHETGMEMGPGEEGRIWAMGPQLPSPGWCLTPDVGHYNEATDKFEITGHAGDTLFVHGLMVDPVEVENVLASHPGVLDVGVFSEGEGLREVASGVIVPRNPEAPPTERDLRHLLKSRLAPYKHVSNISFADSIPRLSDGRTDRKALAAESKEKAKEIVAMTYI